MDLSALLFSLGLLLAGVWLIFTISGGFKEKRRQKQKAPNASRQNPHPVRNVSPSAGHHDENSLHQPSTPPKADVPNSSAISIEKGEPPDPFQGLNASVVRKTFERFTRES